MKILSNAVWEVLSAQLAEKDRLIQRAHERIDRLVEAVSRKQNIPIIMPQAELPKFQPAVTLERSPGYFDTKPIPPIPPSGAKQS